jgi:CDP-paratose 2-epimerase
MTRGKREAENPKQPILGVVESFAPGDRRQIEASIQVLESLGVHHIRVRLSRADWYTADGRDWWEWLMGTLSRRLAVLPCLAYTPLPSTTSEIVSLPQEDPRAFADFVDGFVRQFGRALEWIELPSEPDSSIGWDWRLDPRGRVFSEIIGAAAYRCRQRGIQTALGNIRASDANWVNLLCENGVIDFADAIGLHVVRGTGLYGATPPSEAVDRVRRILREHRQRARLWITEAGCPTSSHDEFAQLQAFARLLDADVERIYWHSLRDPDPALSRPTGFHQDERHYHLGLCRRNGAPKLLFRLWNSQGVEGVRRFGRYGSSEVKHSTICDGGTSGRSSAGPHGKGTTRPVLITGGAGFIGSNLAERFLRSGKRVIILDNLSRHGVEHSVRYLYETYGDRVEIYVSDVRNSHIVAKLVARCQSIFHLAAQVAVSAGLADPVGDFEANLAGTVNVLEAARQQDPSPPLLFASTSKVYGDLHDIELIPSRDRYVPRDHHTRTYGIDESRPLEFHGPCGCSKGAADQYVLDFAGMYGMPNVVFRMSCIYGPRQFGTEDEAWVACLALQMLREGQLNVYGDGRQVHDILYVDDLIEAMLLAMEHIDVVAGKAFNIGGGPANAVSFRDVIGYLSELSGITPRVHYSPRRKGDQPYYVSDTRRFSAATGWTPRISAKQGVSQLHQWTLQNARSDALLTKG